jgi:hypothetical protein
MEHPRRSEPESQAGAAVVVLGASNVSRGLAQLAAVATARQPSRETSRLDLFVAAGHGRSFGANSRVFMRRLPSILWCGLWRALDREGVGRAEVGHAGMDDGRPVHALVTDIGNDLLYGFSVTQLTAWVDECLARLAARGATIAITRLPLQSLERVGPVRYRALKRLYVPGCQLSLPDLVAAATELDRDVAGLAARYGATLIEQPGGWYGLDAIHIRRRHLPALWHRACNAWGCPAAAGPARASFGRWAALGRRAPEVRSLAYRMRFTPQPSVHGPGALRLWLY